MAKRNGVRSCTTHPICNFISYDGLSPGFHAFTTSLTDIQIANNIQEAFRSPEWRTTIGEEI